MSSITSWYAKHFKYDQSSIIDTTKGLASSPPKSNIESFYYSFEYLFSDNEICWKRFFIEENFRRQT